MAAVVKKTEGPFGKRGVEEKCSSVGTAPGISADGEAIVDYYDDDWVGLTKRGRGQAAKVTQLCFTEREIVRWASPRRQLTTHGTVKTSAYQVHATLINL